MGVMLIKAFECCEKLEMVGAPLRAGVGKEVYPKLHFGLMKW